VIEVMLKLYESIEIKMNKNIKMEMNSDYNLQIRKHCFFLANKNSSINKKMVVAPVLLALFKIGRVAFFGWVLFV
jgi:hypothetical protein